MLSRERFATRLGFIIISVACAVGLGNIWLLPFRAGMYGGGFYILIFAIFAFALAIPTLMAEYAVGRASQRSCADHFDNLQPRGTKWHFAGYLAIAGNYLLLMFYITVCGFSLAYLWKGINGSLIGQSPEYIAAAFGTLTADPARSAGYTVAILVLCFMVTVFGLKNGLERIGKYLMLTFFGLLIVLIVRGLTLPGAMDGLAFIFIPRIAPALEFGIFRVIHMAMGQALFSVSVGIGAMAIFGSYIGKDKSLVSESATVGAIDLLVSILCLLMIFPAAFAFGINPASGAGLIFITMPNVFNHMPASYLWSLLFYIGLLFVSFSTAVAVYENIVAYGMDKFGWSRKQSTLINLVLLSLLCMPAAFGTNIWAHIQPFGFANFSAFFTFLVSDNILPIGSMLYVMFCMSKRGWGFESFLAEVNTGDGMRFPTNLRFYMTYVVPVAIFIIFIVGHINRFLLS